MCKVTNTLNLLAHGAVWARKKILDEVASYAILATAIHV